MTVIIDRPIMMFTAELRPRENRLNGERKPRVDKAKISAKTAISRIRPNSLDRKKRVLDSPTVSTDGSAGGAEVTS